MFYLDEKLWFPAVDESTADGLLAIGGDLSVDRLMLAYNSGIFPWYEKGQPILWWSPNPRMVLFPEKFKVSKSFRRTLNGENFEISFNKNFSEVIKNCASVKRKRQQGTWITKEMQEAYIALHKAGHASSVEVWQEEKLVGGIYGIDLSDKKIFCGESMFSKVSNASKVAFYNLAQILKEKNYKMIDCQIYNDHLESLGAEEISRERFFSILNSTE